MISLEDNLVDFLTRVNAGPTYAQYRQRCLRHWIELHGYELVAKVAAMAKEPMPDDLVEVHRCATQSR